jgi:hypothetical protein
MRLDASLADRSGRLGRPSEAEGVSVELGYGARVEGFGTREALHLVDQFRVRASPRRALEVRNQASRDAIAEQQGAARRAPQICTLPRTRG